MVSDIYLKYLLMQSCLVDITASYLQVVTSAMWRNWSMEEWREGRKEGESILLTIYVEYLARFNLK